MHDARDRTCVHVGSDSPRTARGSDVRGESRGGHSCLEDDLEGRHRRGARARRDRRHRRSHREAVEPRRSSADRRHAQGLQQGRPRRVLVGRQQMRRPVRLDRQMGILPQAAGPRRPQEGRPRRIARGHQRAPRARQEGRRQAPGHARRPHQPVLQRHPRHGRQGDVAGAGGHAHERRRRGHRQPHQGDQALLRQRHPQ